MIVLYMLYVFGSSRFYNDESDAAKYMRTNDLRIIMASQDKIRSVRKPVECATLASNFVSD